MTSSHRHINTSSPHRHIITSYHHIINNYQVYPQMTHTRYTWGAHVSPRQ
eukprot:m.115733 g.115733  ORF g.115733 m.115733 type:complete len:50 (-) comp28444_c0_seq1:1419-1568(-)